MALNPLRSPLLRAFALAAIGCTVTGWAHAQWQWIDGTGSRVFSDTPPPAGTPDKNIIKRPGPARLPVAAPTPTASSPMVSATSASLAPTKAAGKDGELEARKKQAEEAEVAKKKAEHEKALKARAENCERSKRAKATIDSGVRIAITNAKGETEFLDDKARAAEGQRIEGLIKSECGPLPQAAVQ